MAELEFRVNGQRVCPDAAPGSSLLDVLREELGICSAKYGCGMAQCGACTVLVDGRAARACVYQAVRVRGREVTTLEGLACSSTGALHPVQRGFLEGRGAQCGYCLNGMVMTATALLTENPDADEAAVRRALRDNLCRCGTHREIIASVLKAAGFLSPPVKE